MSWDEVAESVCPIARSLSVVGEYWTLLIMRELVMGMHKFEEIQAQTGMSSHLLTTRLKGMEKDGLIERKLYSTRPARYEYRATAMGKELDAVLLALRAWGTRWCGYEPGSEPAVTLVHKKSGETIDPSWQVPRGDPPFSFDHAEVSISPAWQAEREERRVSFQNGKQRRKKPQR